MNSQRQKDVRTKFKNPVTHTDSNKNSRKYLQTDRQTENGQKATTRQTVARNLGSLGIEITIEPFGTRDDSRIEM